MICEGIKTVTRIFTKRFKYPLVSQFVTSSLASDEGSVKLYSVPDVDTTTFPSKVKEKIAKGEDDCCTDGKDDKVTDGVSESHGCRNADERRARELEN